MSARLISPVMVGRGEQLAALRQSFDRVRAGSPATVLLGGEAGAGKTRLIAEFAHVVAGQAVLLSGACVDLGGEGLAFAPFTAALRGLVRQVAGCCPPWAVTCRRILALTLVPPRPGSTRSCLACWRISPTSGPWCW
jgi:predicted ATPase